jgi:hypothetical protein
LAAALTARHHPVSHTTVGGLLRERGSSLQANRKTEEGRDHPDRDAQFRHINAAVTRGLRAGLPVISVDTNYDPARIMDTRAGAACRPPSADGRAAAHLIRPLYT